MIVTTEDAMMMMMMMMMIPMMVTISMNYKTLSLANSSYRISSCDTMGFMVHVPSGPKDPVVMDL